MLRWLVPIVCLGVMACEDDLTTARALSLSDAAVALPDAEAPRGCDLGCAPIFQTEDGCDPDPSRCGPDEVPVVDEGCLKVGLPVCAPEFLKDGRCRPEPADCGPDEVPVPAEGCVRVGPACAAVFVGPDGQCRPGGCGALEVPVPSVGCVPVGPACRTLAEVQGPGIFVQVGAEDGDGSVARPFGHIAEAFAAAVPGDRVVLGPGRYEEPTAVPRGVTLEGVCAAEVVLAGRSPVGRPPDTSEAAVVLAADSTLRGVTAEGPFGVVFLRTGAAAVEGVRIRAQGGGINVAAGTLNVRESVIDSLAPTAEIGALAVRGSRLNLERVLIHGPFGHGVDADNATVVVADSVVVDGEGESPWPRRGIVASLSGRVTVTGSVVSGWQGCGVRSLGRLFMQDSAVLDGRWYPDRLLGNGREARGGLCIDDAAGTMRVESSIVRRNAQAGAASAGDLELWRVRVEGTWDPHADEHGSMGVWFAEGTGNLRESLVVGNEDRGVLITTPQAISIEDSIIAHNQREGDGVGLLANPPTEGEGAEVEVLRSVLVDNGAFEAGSVDRVLAIRDSVVVSRTPLLRPDGELQAIGLAVFNEEEEDERSPLEGWPGGGLRGERLVMEGQQSFGVVAWVGTGLWLEGLVLRNHRAVSGEGGGGIFVNQNKAARLSRLLVEEAEVTALFTLGSLRVPLEVTVDRAVVRTVRRPASNPDHLGAALYAFASRVSARGLDARDLVGAGVIAVGNPGDQSHLDLQCAHLAQIAPGAFNGGFGLWADHNAVAARGLRIDASAGAGVVGVGSQVELTDVTITSVRSGGGFSVVGHEVNDGLYMADAAHLTGTRIRATGCGTGLRLSGGSAAEVSDFSTDCEQSAVLHGQTTLEVHPPLVPPPRAGEPEGAHGMQLPSGFTNQAEAPSLDPPR